MFGIETKINAIVGWVICEQSSLRMDEEMTDQTETVKS